jgi:calcineurin-like phosphoesterase family protein
MERIFFTADTHIGHKSILKYCDNRATDGNFSIEDTEAHDKWLIDNWNKTVGKKDIIYILGDFSFLPSENLKKHILPKLNGQKYLILGNHDKSSQSLTGYFKQITQMKELVFKQKRFDFLEEDFKLFLCHYPMVTWNNKHYGSCQLHGHCHNRLTEYNNESTDLRLDIGIDSDIAQFKPVPLEKVYRFFKDKTQGMVFVDYAQRQKIEKTGEF